MLQNVACSTRCTSSLASSSWVLWHCEESKQRRQLRKGWSPQLSYAILGVPFFGFTWTPTCGLAEAKWWWQHAQHPGEIQSRKSEVKKKREIPSPTGLSKASEKDSEMRNWIQPVAALENLWAWRLAWTRRHAQEMAGGAGPMSHPFRGFFLPHSYINMKQRRQLSISPPSNANSFIKLTRDLHDPAPMLFTNQALSQRHWQRRSQSWPFLVPHAAITPDNCWKFLGKEGGKPSWYTALFASWVLLVKFCDNEAFKGFWWTRWKTQESRNGSSKPWRSKNIQMLSMPSHGESFMPCSKPNNRVSERHQIFKRGDLSGWSEMVSGKAGWLGAGLVRRWCKRVHKLHFWILRFGHVETQFLPNTSFWGHSACSHA